MLPLEELMRRQGAVLPPAPSADALHEHDLAAKRCRTCTSQKMCLEALQSGGGERHRLFCPNAHYVAWVRHNALRF